jgi:hypothetical protein
MCLCYIFRLLEIACSIPAAFILFYYFSLTSGFSAYTQRALAPSRHPGWWAQRRARSGVREGLPQSPLGPALHEISLLGFDRRPDTLPRYPVRPKYRGLWGTLFPLAFSIWQKNAPSCLLPARFCDALTQKGNKSRVRKNVLGK